MPNLAGAVITRSSLASLPYPGRVIKKKERDKNIVLAVQRRLNESGVGPIDEDGDFGNGTESAVKLFQMRFADQDGVPLKVDGQIGPITWGMLFGMQSVPVVIDPDMAHPLLAKALAFAVTQVGIREKPLGSNRGPQVDKYLKSAGLDPARGSYPWCAAFIYYCFEHAAKELGQANPLVRTAGVLDHWNRAAAKGATRITRAKAMANPSLIKPGYIFIMDYGGGAGHTGLVERVTGGKLVTIEGNTNDGGSREGIGVFRRTQRKIVSINKGFLDYGR